MAFNKKTKYYWIVYNGKHDMGSLVGSTIEGTPYSLLQTYCEQVGIDVNTIVLTNYKRISRKECKKMSLHMSLQKKGNVVSDNEKL